MRLRSVVDLPAIAVATLLTLSTATTASATTIVFNNGSPNGFGGTEFTRWIQADDFTLTATADITGINFWAFPLVGTIGSAYTGSITWQIYDTALTSNGMHPGTVLASGTASPTPVFSHTHTVLGVPSYSFSFTIPAFTAVAGTTYYLGLHNGPLTTTNELHLYLDSANGNFIGARQDEAPFGDSWTAGGSPHQPAFYLTTDDVAAVPEPNTLVLTALGLVALARRRKRRG